MPQTSSESINAPKPDDDTLAKLVKKIATILQPYIGTGMAGQAIDQIRDYHKRLKATQQKKTTNETYKLE